MRRLATQLAVCVAVTLAAAPVRADSGPARVHYEAGQRHYRGGDYVRAAGYFLRAHEHRKLPAFLFNAAQAYRRAKVCDLAAALYREFLDAEPDSRSRPVVERHLEAMNACVADGTGSVAGADSPGASRRDQVGWLSTGLGLGLVTAAGLLVWDADRASDEESDVLARGDKDKRTEREAEATQRRGRSQALAWITGAAGAAALVTGAVLLLSDRKPDVHSAPQVAAVEGGAVVGWTWGF